MLNQTLHKKIFIDVLRTIYTDSLLRNLLGFKGGTAAMLFYGLPRFSVDLDFDLLDATKKDEVLFRLKTILPQFGELKQAVEKHCTLFCLLNYQEGERNLKIEISKRPLHSKFVVKNYLGISMLVMDKPNMMVGKLAALLTRKKFAIRDVFDLWFFLKNSWGINEKLILEKTGMNLSDALTQAQEKIQSIKSTDMLSGIGELVDAKQKAWVKEKLKEETIFYLRLYGEL